MGNEHHITVINKQIEVLELADNKINWSDTENMYLDEIEYLIYTYKTIYGEKQKNKDDKHKSIMEFAAKAFETLCKLLQNLGKQR